MEDVFTTEGTENTEYPSMLSAFSVVAKPNVCY